jgi:uncharacterized protein VirK/YbjX
MSSVVYFLVSIVSLLHIQFICREFYHREILRQIVRQIDKTPSNISEFLHKQMLKTTTTTQKYIKNSFELKEQLKNIKKDINTIIITADIESLYTNIPQEIGSQIVTDTMFDNNNDYKPTIKKPTFKTLVRN